MPAVRTWRAAAGVAEREAFMLPVLAMLLVALLQLLPQQLQADSWLTLVSGREIVEHGLPSVDSLATWTQGSPWVDQQWLAQVILYGLTVAGGSEARADRERHVRRRRVHPRRRRCPLTRGVDAW